MAWISALLAGFVVVAAQPRMAAATRQICFALMTALALLYAYSRLGQPA